MISIIVPIYNSIKYLSFCLDSIVNQSMRDIEIILVDDGSTDGSEKICDEFADRDKRVKVIHKENGGLVNARKVGLNASNGEFIGFVDSDDWIEPDMYEKLYNAMVQETVDVVMCGRAEEFTNYSKKVYQGIPEGRYEGESLLKEVFPQMLVNESFFEWGLFPSFWDKLFKKECLSDYLLKVDERIVMGEDAACVYPCLLHSKSIFVIHECLYHYRQSSSSMVRKTVDGCRKERMRFRILYESVYREFCDGQDIFDLREQWKKYVLFLMTPRADILYEGVEDLDYLYPFPQIKKGSRIVIYCAGLWGRRLYEFLKETEFCKVVAIADQNFQTISEKGFEVISPNEIGELDFDAIAVTASFAHTRNSVISYLRDLYPHAKIYGLDKGEVFSDKSLVAFRLK